MKRFGKLMLSAWGLLTVLCAIAAAQKTSPVIVTNTSANPVPTVATGTTAVTGTVGITNLPLFNP